MGMKKFGRVCLGLLLPALLLLSSCGKPPEKAELLQKMNELLHGYKTLSFDFTADAKMYEVSRPEYVFYDGRFSGEGVQAADGICHYKEQFKGKVSGAEDSYRSESYLLPDYTVVKTDFGGAQNVPFRMEPELRGQSFFLPELSVFGNYDFTKAGDKSLLEENKAEGTWDLKLVIPAEKLANEGRCYGGVSLFETVNLRMAFKGTTPELLELELKARPAELTYMIEGKYQFTNIKRDVSDKIELPPEFAEAK